MLASYFKTQNIYSEFLTGNEKKNMNLNKFLVELLGSNSTNEYKDWLKTLIQWNHAESAFI